MHIDLQCPLRSWSRDVVMVPQVARHRVLQSAHIAAVAGWPRDRPNDRLSRLFHAGYIDRPRAKLGYYPTAGSDWIVYALADRYAQLPRRMPEQPRVLFAQ